MNENETNIMLGMALTFDIFYWINLIVQNRILPALFILQIIHNVLREMRTNA